MWYCDVCDVFSVFLRVWHKKKLAFFSGQKAGASLFCRWEHIGVSSSIFSAELFVKDKSAKQRKQRKPSEMTITTIPVLRRLPLVLYPFILIFLLYITLDHANISTFLLPAADTKNKSYKTTTTSRNSGVIIPSSTQNVDRQYPNHHSLFVSAVQIPVPTCNQTAFNLGEIDCLTYDPNEAHVPCSEV